MRIYNVLLFLEALTSSSMMASAFAPLPISNPGTSFMLDAGAVPDDDEALINMAEGLLGRSIPTNPFAQDSNRPSKGDVYQSDELQTLLELHRDLEALQQPQQQPEKVMDESDLPGLHETVLQMLRESGDLAEPAQENEGAPALANDWLDDASKAKIRQVRAIASDVDGTLLTSAQTMHPRTKQAVKKAISMAFSPLEKLQYFFPATGKSRAGAMASVGPDIAKLLSQTPGVFLQGLYCVDGQGEVIFQRKLNILQVEAVEAFATNAGISVVAYDGDQLWTTEVTEAVRTLHETYKEPMPQLLEAPISEYGPSVNKILLIDFDVDRLANEVRPQLEVLAEEYDATVTQAMPTMLEWLPSGCSKALGVEKLCEKLGIDASTQLMALGDGENDVEMLKLASIGVAVGNAAPLAREACDFVMTETNDEGGAGAAMEVFGFGLY